MYTTGTVVESQPDWITASIHAKQRIPSLKHFSDTLIAGELDAGAKVRAWAFYGYKGYSVGRVRYGERDEAACLQLSGDLAARNLSHTALLTDSITRLDIAVTVRLPEPDDEAGTRAYNEAVAARLVRPRAALPKLVRDGNHGMTLYIGDRSSDVMLRMYNKEQERLADKDKLAAEKYARCWRYEIEAKGKIAPQLARTIEAERGRADACQAIVHQWVVDHGMTPLFPPSGSQALMPGFHRRSDRDRTLDWFRSSVGPSIRRLLQTGPSQEVYDALGLPPPPPSIDDGPPDAPHALS